LLRILHNRRVVFAGEFLKHYADHFRSDYLFFFGDVNPRLSIGTIGEMYLFDLPFLLIGLFFLIKTRPKAAQVLLFWLFLAPIPAAMARETPHALRTLNMLPVPQIITAYGFVMVSLLISPSKFRKMFLSGVLSIYLLFVGFYLHDYYFHYAKDSAMSWQYGYKEMVKYVSENQKDYSNINISETYGRPYIYMLFYLAYSPEKFWRTRNTDRDWYGFWYVHGFDKYTFGDNTMPSSANLEKGGGKTLFVRGPNGAPAGNRLLTTIKDFSDNTIFEISQN
jgi:hypothetical protein